MGSLLMAPWTVKTLEEKSEDTHGFGVVAARIVSRATTNIRNIVHPHEHGPTGWCTSTSAEQFLLRSDRDRVRTEYVFLEVGDRIGGSSSTVSGSPSRAASPVMTPFTAPILDHTVASRMVDQAATEVAQVHDYRATIVHLRVRDSINPRPFSNHPRGTPLASPRDDQPPAAPSNQGNCS